MIKGYLILMGFITIPTVVVGFIGFLFERVENKRLDKEAKHILYRQLWGKKMNDETLDLNVNKFM